MRAARVAGTAALRLGWRFGVWIPGLIALAISTSVVAIVRDSPESLGRCASLALAFGGATRALSRLREPSLALAFGGATRAASWPIAPRIARARCCALRPRWSAVASKRVCCALQRTSLADGLVTRPLSRRAALRAA